MWGFFFLPDYFDACTIYSALKTRLQFILKLLVLRVHNQSIVFWTTVSESSSSSTHGFEQQTHGSVTDFRFISQSCTHSLKK
jgi:hypothetical protein